MPTEKAKESKKRAPRKTARKAGSATTARKRAPAKTTRTAKRATKTTTRTTKTTRGQSVVRKTAARSTRKAPTGLAERKGRVARESKSRRRKTLIIAASLMVVLGGSIALGFSDSGEINVSQTVTTRVEEARERGEDVKMPAPQTERNKKPNGGLVSSGKPQKTITVQKPAITPTVAPTASTTATSTATSTESMSNETESAAPEEELSSEDVATSSDEEI